MAYLTVTLNVDEELIAKAEALAAAKHISVSQLLERLLRADLEAADATASEKSK